MAHYDEYHAARTSAALRDAQASFRLYMCGADHLDFLHRMTSNDFHNLQIGYGLETVFIEQRARILDLATCYRGPHATALILSPDSRAAIPAWLDRFIFTEALELTDQTDETAMFELVGPHAAQLVTRVLNANLATFQDHQLLDSQVADDLWLARTAGPGLRAFGPPDAVKDLWQRLATAGARPIDSKTWEILRVEQGLPLLGRELIQNYNPWEAGLGRAIHLDKGCYIGQEVIARLDTYDKVKQHLVGLRLSVAELPPTGQPLRDGAREVGRITSAVHSPSLGPIALAYVRRSACAEGTALDAGGPQATVVSLPFLLHESR
ncbi:MAG: aminomethyl transferase family protein [Gemmatimonadetes bacterium]|nr:aminomethyl transferase family protein [Gemmatimonadota bacterium]MYB69105.1 aminomethyl transferase family protein [Gemmatimonadota bacterium]